jgi:hypothetical protein
MAWSMLMEPCARVRRAAGDVGSTISRLHSCLNSVYVNSVMRKRQEWVWLSMAGCSRG